MCAFKVSFSRRFKFEIKFWGASLKFVIGFIIVEVVSEFEDILCVDCLDCGVYDLCFINFLILILEEEVLDEEFVRLFSFEWFEFMYVVINMNDFVEMYLIMEDFKKIDFGEGWFDYDFFCMF